MNLKEINSVKTPHLFYLPDETRPEITYDEKGEVLETKYPYTLSCQEIQFKEGISYRKRAENEGLQDLHIYNDCCKLFYNNKLAAVMKLYLETVDTKTLAVTKELDGLKSTITKDVLTDKVSAEMTGFKINSEFIGGDPKTERKNKLTFYLEKPGYVIRGRMVVTIYNEFDTILDYSDYKGNIEENFIGFDEEKHPIYEIIFEPKGVKDSLIIDPYLSIDEQSTYVNVTCDGYILRIAQGAVSSKIYMLNGSTVLCNLETGSLRTSAGYFEFDIDSNRVLEILENNSTRVVIRVTGNLYETGPTVMANSTSYQVIWTIYSDRYTWQSTWVTSDTITLVSSGGLFRLEFGANTNEDYIYEDGAAEKNSGNGGSVGIKTGDYIGLTSDEVNLQVINLEHTEVGATFDEYIWSAAVGVFSRYTTATTISAGTHTIANMVIVDTEERVGAALLYDSADRLVLGIQYKNDTAATINTGTAITDQNIPDIITDADGQATDAARHIDHSSNAGKITFGQAENCPAIVVPDWPLLYGASPGTDPLLGYLKCDDIDVDTVVDDVLGAYDGELVNATCDEVTNSDAVRGKSFLFNGTDEYINWSSILAHATFDESNFTIMMKVKPNHTITPGSESYFYFSYGVNDFITLYFTSAQQAWTLGLYFGGNSYSIAAACHTGSYYKSNTNLQQWHTIKFGINVAKKFGYLAINDAIFITPTIAEDWAGKPTVFHIAGLSYYGAFYAEEIKLFDGCIIPFGGGPWVGNGEVEVAVADEDVNFLWNGADVTPIGTDITSNGDYTQDAPSGDKAFRNDQSDANPEYASAATAGNISAAEGMLCFWFAPNAALAGDCTFFYADAAFKIWWDDSDNDIVFLYNTDSVRMTTAFPADDIKWHPVVCRWKASTYLEIEVDGLGGASSILQTGVDVAPTLDATMFFTADDASETNVANIMIANFAITDNPYTPDNWSNFGQSIWLPKVQLG